MFWVILILVILFLVFSLKRVPQNYVGLVETFGKYSHKVTAGLHFVWPFVQTIRRVSLALQPLTIPKYSVISKDNADVTVSLTLNYIVSNAQRYFYDNTNSEESLIQLVRGHLRNIVGTMTLNEILGKTAEINKKLFGDIDNLTDSFGVHVIRLNIDELTPSDEIQQAMDQQLTADRKREAAISKAEGSAKSIELNNKAQNDALLATAKAKANAKKVAADAEAYRINQLNQALGNAGQGYFANQSLDAFDALANGNDNLVVLSKDEMTKLASIPAVKKVWDQSGERTRGNQQHSDSENSDVIG